MRQKVPSFAQVCTIGTEPAQFHSPMPFVLPMTFIVEGTGAGVRAKWVRALMEMTLE